MSGQLDGADSINILQDGLSSNYLPVVDPEHIDSTVNLMLDLLRAQPARFERISELIICIANFSKKEDDAKTLFQVLMIVYQKALDETDMASMCARLCRVMMERVSPSIKHRGMTESASGKPQGGSSLLRRLLLGHCQERFEFFSGLTLDSQGGQLEVEGGWKVTRPAEPHLPALSRFLAELFNLQMLTERIMHECIKALLSEENPDSCMLKAACTLLRVAGPNLDHLKAKMHMDVYISRLSHEAHLNVDIELSGMLTDLIHCRDRNWVSTSETNVFTANRYWRPILEHINAIDENNLDDHAAEFFKTKTIDAKYFNNVPVRQRSRFVEKLSLRALHGGDADTWLLAALFAHASRNGCCSTMALRQGLSLVMQKKDVSSGGLSILLASIGSNGV